MPPNLGGFFMVRSYYPSECHADYFDFERIEALKPAIEACGISTLTQSPMLGFHKQMDNRIKLLEEILSFRMQGVEFDNGDMYVDGHKAASDVRDEFVSVTEKLMDELAQCYNVLPQLDINRSEERFSRNTETDLVCRLLLEKKKETYIVKFSNLISQALSNYGSVCPFYIFLFYWYGFHPVLHSFPTRRSSDLTAIRLLLTFVMSLYLLLRS